MDCRRRQNFKTDVSNASDQKNAAENASVEDNTNWSLRKLWLHDEVPAIFREPFIEGAYRPPKCTLSECLIGMIWPLHNETWNIWTHLLPGLYFTGLLVYLVMHDNSKLFFNSPLGLPMAIFLCTSGLYGLLSAAAHLFNTLSMHARHIAFTFDYLAISLYSYGCASAYRSYSFPKNNEYTNEDDDIAVASYLPIALFLAATSHLVACYTRLAPDPSPIIIHSGRFFAYVVPYFFVTWPILYRYYLWYFYADSLDFSAIGITQHGIHFIFSFAAAFFYLSHIPERFSPGRFDVFGHSHQLFHLCTIAATQFQYDAFLEDFKDRNCYASDQFAGQGHMWPCDAGMGFNSEKNLVSPSFLSSSIVGLVVHNLMACSLLAAIVVPRVVERHHRHHHHHHGRHHRQKVKPSIQTPTTFSEDVFRILKNMKLRIVRIGSFRHRQ